MTKKEKQEFDDLKNALARAKAFRFTEDVVRDLPIPSSYSGLSLGWDFNTYSLRVYKACSSSVSHGEGWEKTTSQRGIPLFSSELLALKAMRRTLEEQYSKELARLDEKIQWLSA